MTRRKLGALETQVLGVVEDLMDLDPDHQLGLGPLLALLEGLARKFDGGEMAALEVQQLRQGFKEVRDVMAAARADQVGGRGSGLVEKLLAEKTGGK